VGNNGSCRSKAGLNREELEAGLWLLSCQSSPYPCRLMAVESCVHFQTMSQFSTSLNVSENDDESRVGTDVHGRLFNDRRGWPTTPDPDPAPILQ